MATRHDSDLLHGTAFALVVASIVGLGVVAGDAQSPGSDQTARERQSIKKTLDDKTLTPVRPIRRVGPDSWPPADQASRKKSAAEERNDRGKIGPGAIHRAPSETNGQAPQEASSEQKPAAANTAPAPQQTAQQPPAAEQDKKPNDPQNTANQTAPTAPQASVTNKQGNAQGNGTAPAASKDAAAGGPRHAPQQATQLGTDANGRVAINEQQETKISAALRKQNVQPANNVNFKIEIGAVAPDSIRLGAVSADIVEVLPQFRGYSFFATREEIVIVEPASKKIVALLPVKLTATAEKKDTEKRVRETRETERTIDQPVERDTRSWKSRRPAGEWREERRLSRREQRRITPTETNIVVDRYGRVISKTVRPIGPREAAGPGRRETVGSGRRETVVIEDTRSRGRVYDEETETVPTRSRRLRLDPGASPDFGRLPRDVQVMD